MKTLLITLLVLCIQAHAADHMTPAEQAKLDALGDALGRGHTQVDPDGFCRAYGLAYLAAAYARDLDNPPAMALEFTEPYRHYLSEPLRKAIVNQVYFSPAFSRAGGDALRIQMARECLTGPRKWEALK